MSRYDFTALLNTLKKSDIVAYNFQENTNVNNINFLLDKKILEKNTLIRKVLEGGTVAFLHPNQFKNRSTFQASLTALCRYNQPKCVAKLISFNRSFALTHLDRSINECVTRSSPEALEVLLREFNTEVKKMKPSYAAYPTYLSFAASYISLRYGVKAENTLKVFTLFLDFNIDAIDSCTASNLVRASTGVCEHVITALRLLIKHNCPVSYLTAALSASYANPEITVELLDANAEVVFPSCWSSFATQIKSINKSNFHLCKRVIEALIANTPQLNSPEVFKALAILSPKPTGHVIPLLMEAGLDFSQDKTAFTARGNPKLAMYYLDNGGDPFYVDTLTKKNILHFRCDTPLHANGEIQVLESLLNHGVDPNEKDNAGNIPLLTYCKRGSIGEYRKIIQLFLDYGCEYNEPNYKGETCSVVGGPTLAAWLDQCKKEKQIAKRAKGAR